MEIDSSLKADKITSSNNTNKVININNANSNNYKNSLPDILSEYNEIINKQEKEIEKTVITKDNKQHTYFESLIEQSKYDTRKIKHLRFKSNFQMLLVSDSRTDKSAAAMNVNIGSLLDPKDYQGLAHFLEHMLFMGTDLFPNENEFDEFMNKNSGFSNAFTGDENTVFYYNINEKAFKDSLLRFSRFFIAPLFMESSVKREVKAVDSEYCDSKTNDFWREMQVKSQEKNENSVERCFGMGCKKTLIKDEIRNKVVEFYQKYYKSNMMSLVIVSKIDINALEEIVFDIFYEYFEKNSEVNEKANNNCINVTTDAPETKETITNIVSNTNNTINTTYLISNKINNDANSSKEEKQYYINSLFLPNFTYSKFEKEVLINNKMKPALSNNNNEHFPYVKNKNISQLYYIKPSASIHSLSFDFIIKKDHYSYPRNPVLAFITIILGHESKHSVTHLLKQLDLISDLSTSYTNNSYSYSMFSVTLKMTDKGFNNWELVLCLFFSYIEYFKKNAVNERYLDEFKYQAYQSFVYDNNISSDISDIAVDLTESFSYFNKENIISKDKIFYGRDCTGVFEFLNEMNFDNMNIYFSSKRTEYGHLDFSHEEFLTEEWYKVKYKKTAIKEEMKNKWRKIIECLSRINIEKRNENNTEDDVYNKQIFDINSEVLKILRSNKESDIIKINMDLFSNLQTNFNYPDKNDFISYNMKIKDYMNYKIRNTCKLSNDVSNKDSEYNYYIDEESTINETTKPIYPQLLKNTPLSKIFFKQDYVFKLPKVIIASKIYLNIDQFEKIKSKNLLALLLQLIEDELMDIIYKASDCETCISLSFSNNGINLLVNGFNDKILLVLSEFIKDLETKLLELKENLLNEKFAINKIKTKLENILKDKKLSLNDSPDDQANELLKLILFKENTWVEDDIKFLEDIYNNKMKYEEDDESSEEDSEGSDDSKDNEDSKDEDEEEEEIDTSKELNDSKESKDSTNTKDSKEYEFVNPIKTNVLIEMIDSIFKEIKFNWLIQGNSTVEEAVVIVNKAEDLLIKMFNSISYKKNPNSENKEEEIKQKPQPIEEKKDLNLDTSRLNKIKTLEKIAKYHILSIPKQTELQYYFENRDKEEENYSTLVYYQVGNLSASISSLSTDNLSTEAINENKIKLKKLLTSSILNSIMYDSFFDSLRTKQQIGYSVSCFLIDHLNTKGFIFLVKSSKLDSNEIYERINNFIYDFYMELIKKSEDYFVSYVNALLLELKNRFTCLEEETNYYWSLILNEKENTFDYKNLLINYLTENGISKEDVCCFYKEVFSENIKKVSVFVNPNKNVVEKLLKKKEKENNKNNAKKNKETTNNKEICNEEISLNSNISVAQKLKSIIISDESNIKNEEKAENVLSKNDFLAKKRVRISSINDFKREYDNHYHN